MQPPEKKDFLDIEEVSAEIRERLRLKVERGEIPPVAEPPRRPITTSVTAPWRLNASDDLWKQVTGGQLLVGAMPPSPPTLRGRIGRLLVASARRAVFWLTPQIQAFQRATAAAIREQASALRELAGGVSGLAAAQASIRSLEERLSTLEASLVSLEDRTRSDISELRNLTARHSAEIRAEIGAREAIAFRTDAIVQDLHKVGRSLPDHEQLAAKLRDIEEYSRSTRADLMLQHQQLAMLRRAQGLARAAGMETPVEQDSIGDAVYVEFEHSFRGSYTDIRNRLTVYLPRLDNFSFGGTDSPLVDLGCGRGEWLSLLRDRGLVAYGVDSNTGMVNACQRDGLVVQHEDLLAHLRSLPANSRGGATAFHVVEHLPPAILDAFLNELLRVLKPGGILILETPNPRNVFVGSNTFYLDPTHCKPVPSDLLRFLLQARGFAAIEVLPLHPYPPEAKLNLPGNRAAEFIDEYFFGPQDYGIICRKPETREGDEI